MSQINNVSPHFMNVERGKLSPKQAEERKY